MHPHVPLETLKCKNASNDKTWHHGKSIVYNFRPQHLEELRERIAGTCHANQRDVLMKMFNKVQKI